MNKQALAFLTMFSLILMLSVYYVTLPADSTSVMEEQSTQTKEETKQETATSTPSENEKQDQSKTEEAQEQKKDTSESADSSKLQDSINQKKEEEINRNSSVVADTKSDDAAKKEALAAIDELKDEKALQKSVADILKKEGYQTAVEISENTCIITVFEQKDDKNAAKTIMQKAQEATNHKYLMEVTFK
ncbi:stage III sporulation protein AH [[Clostridium] innocuum]|nr:stage III sporulation protein AH [[Clostridium] innocuum]MCR0327954.1 stage III sporulation protein AH [[Clostridium] innocuum]